MNIISQNSEEERVEIKEFICVPLEVEPDYEGDFKQFLKDIGGKIYDIEATIPGVKNTGPGELRLYLNCTDDEFTTMQFKYNKYCAEFALMLVAVLSSHRTILFNSSILSHFNNKTKSILFCYTCANESERLNEIGKEFLERDQKDGSNS
jgi:hypothetical protein